MKVNIECKNTILPSIFSDGGRVADEWQKLAEKWRVWQTVDL
jgi:hypothetical protein